MGYKSIPRFHPGYGHRPSLIDALTGAPGMAFPRIRLGSGIVSGRGTDALHHLASSLGILPGTRVFVTAFHKKEFSTFFWESQSPERGNPVQDRGNVVGLAGFGFHNRRLRPGGETFCSSAAVSENRASSTGETDPKREPSTEYRKVSLHNANKIITKSCAN